MTTKQTGYPLPDDNKSRKIVESLRRRSDIAPAPEMTNFAPEPTKRMVRRAVERDKFPAWAEKHVEAVIAATMPHYVGDLHGSGKKPTAVFVFHGERFEGVHNAGAAWVAHIGGEYADEVRRRDLEPQTIGTHLSGIRFAIVGSSMMPPHVKNFGDDQTDMFDKELDDLSSGAGDEPPPTEGPASSHPIAPDDAVPIDDVDAGPPRVSLRCPGCDVEHGDWEIRRTYGGQFLIARCGRCEGESAFRFHGFMSDGFPA